MCLISIAGVGTDKKSEHFFNSIENGMIANSDGSGFAYWKKGTDKIVWSKGYMPTYVDHKGALKEMWNDIIDAKLTEDDLLVVHHRTSTSGLTDKFNCHPFNLSLKKDSTLHDVTKIKGTCSHGVMFHNGVIRDYSRENKNYSDTASFTHAIFSSKPEMYQLLRRDKMLFHEVLRKVISTTKLAFLVPKEVIILGDFLTDSFGYIHSNYGYRSSKYRDYGGNRTFELYDESDFESVYAENYGIANPNYVPSINVNHKPVIDDPTKYKKFLPIYEEEVAEVVEDVEELISPYNNNAISPDKIVKLLEPAWAKHQMNFKYLLMLDKDHALNFKFVLKEQLGRIEAKSEVRCYDFDYSAKTCTIISRKENTETTVSVCPVKLMDNCDLIPTVLNAGVYVTYSTLCNLHLGTNNIKYLKNILKNKKGKALIQIKKPKKMSISSDGLKLYFDMLDLKTAKFPGNVQVANEISYEWSENITN